MILLLLVSKLWNVYYVLSACSYFNFLHIKIYMTFITCNKNIYLSFFISSGVQIWSGSWSKTLLPFHTLLLAVKTSKMFMEGSLVLSKLKMLTLWPNHLNTKVFILQIILHMCSTKCIQMKHLLLPICHLEILVNAHY